MNRSKLIFVALAASALAAGCGEDRAVQSSAPAVQQPAQPAAAAPAPAQVAAQDEKKDEAAPGADGKAQAARPAEEEKKDGAAK